MPLQFIRAYLDSLLALFLVAACVAVSVSAYQAVLSLEKPKQALLDNIPAGNHQWSIYSGETCVGGFQSELRFEPGTVLIARGEFRVKLHQQVQPIKFFVGSFFNVLDQLVACNVSVESPSGSLNLKLSNPNPIDIEAQFKQGELLTSRSFALPGPVSLRKIRSGVFRVDYSALLGIFEQYSQWMSATPPSAGQLEVRSDPQSQTRCELDQSQAFDLDPIVDQLRQQVKKYQSLLHLPEKK